MPAEQADALSLRVLGRSLSRSTLTRQAQAQGEHAITVRQRLIDAPVVGPPSTKAILPGDQPPEPFTLVIQIDACNIRNGIIGANPKRCADATRNSNVGIGSIQPPVSASTVDAARAHRKQLRAIITERSYVATRGGVDP
jgi:hypothetical protein